MAPDMHAGLQLRMSQRLEMVMTPQMIQSMEMLQLPLMQLEQRIQQELLTNPALELRELSEDYFSGDNDNGASASNDEEAPADPDVGSDVMDRDFRHCDDIDCDWGGYFEDCAPRYGGGDDEEFDLIENASAPALSFQEHLDEQLGDYDISDRQKRLCRQIIYNLDESGYLLVPLADTVDPEEEPPPSMEEVEKALRVVQSMEPAGVGARDLRESLLMQIDGLEQAHPLARAIVDECLDDLAANRLPKIAKTYDVPLESVKEAMQFIRTLKPQPGFDYSPGDGLHVEPDVIVEVDEDGEWDVRLVGGVQPDVSDLFLALYDTTKRGQELRERMLKDPERGEDFKQALELARQGERAKAMREQYQNARWLVTAVQQRERTLLRVSRAIVDRQKDFLAQRTDAPAPLMMQEVADEVGVDISTVSRAVREKYMESPRGVLPLRMFFTRAVGGDGGGGETSRDHIINRVREIIEAEDKAKPLKDDQIMDMLAKEGIDIKRRTVAKYRNSLGFPSHSQRREY